MPRRNESLPTQRYCAWRACGLLMLIFTAVALLGGAPLRAAAPAEGKVDPVAQEINKLQEAGNWRALAVRLEDKNPELRRKAAHALGEVLKDAENKAVLRQAAPLLVDAMLNNSDEQVRQQTGFALRYVLRNTEFWVATPIMQDFIAGLENKDEATQRFCAHGLHENVGKVRDQAVLVKMLSPLAKATATLPVTKAGEDGAEAGELAYFALRQVLEKVDDPAALQSIIPPMIKALQAKEVKRRRYAAHVAMLFTRKVQDKATLKPLVDQLVVAHLRDSDERVRQQAGMALKNTIGQQQSD